MRADTLLKVRLLGPLEIWRGSQRLELPSSKKARALLAYLIATSRAHRRERLVELLWDVADDPKGGLRWCLSKIRQLVDEPQKTRIVADRETVHFQPHQAQVDLFVLRERLQHGVSSLVLKELEDVANLFRGTFLEGLELPDYDDFQAWLVRTREDSLQQQLLVLRAIVSALSGNPADAIPYARQLLQRDPLDEQSRAQLARFLMTVGRQSEARQLVEVGKRLAKELGTGSAGQMEQIERELLHPAPGVTAVSSSSDIASSPPAGGPNWEDPAPFVGREKERAVLRRLLDSAQLKSGKRVLLITGEPGIGKSTLLADLAKQTVSIRGTVLSGSSYEAEARRPYGPWTDAIRALHPSLIGDVLRARLAPLLTGLTPEDETPGGRERLFGAVVELLAARLHSAPPVLLQFDDVQWCDEASAELLHYVVRMTQHRSVSVVIAARSGELPDNELAMRVLRGFRRKGWLDEVQLEPLSREETSKLVEQVSPGANAEAVFEESAGNPLYALELARGWDSFSGAGDPTLAGLIRDRVDRLPSIAGDVLRWAAVLGNQFGVRRLSSLVSLDVNDLTKALETLDRHAIVRDAGNARDPDTLAFTQDIVRRTIYNAISEPRRRLMHARVARILQSETNAYVAAEVVHHASLASEMALAARASVEAGRHCMRIYANAEAVAFARSGMRYSESLPETDRIALQIELMEVSLAARRPRDGEEVAKQLEDLSEKALSKRDVEHARLGFHLLSYVRWEDGDWSAAKRHSLRAEFIARSGDTREQVVAMAEAARCLAMLERDLGQAEALALEARAQAMNAGIEAVAIPDALGILHFHRGAWEDASSFFSSARVMAQRDGDHTCEYRALEHLVVLELERDRADAARVLCADLIGLAGKLREGSEMPFALCLQALADEASGKDVASAIEHALQNLRLTDAKHRLAYALLRATQGDFARGDTEQARARAEEALGLAEILARPSETALAHVVLLRCALSSGDRIQAEHHRRALQPENLKFVAAYVQKAADTTMQRTGGKRGARTA